MRQRLTQLEHIILQYYTWPSGIHLGQKHESTISICVMIREIIYPQRHNMTRYEPYAANINTEQQLTRDWFQLITQTILTVFLAGTKPCNGNSVNVQDTFLRSTVDEDIFTTFGSSVQLTNSILNNWRTGRLHCNPCHHHLWRADYKHIIGL